MTMQPTIATFSAHLYPIFCTNLPQYALHNISDVLQVRLSLLLQAAPKYQIKTTKINKRNSIKQRKINCKLVV